MDEWISLFPVFSIPTCRWFSHQHLKSTVRLPSLPGARVGPGTYQEADCILQRSRPDRKVRARGGRVGEGDPPKEQVLELMGWNHG
jgi:hypothetical protein